MKKLTLLLILTFLFNFTFAEKLVQIRINSDSELKAMFIKSDITIHYTNKDFIIASVNDNYTGDCIPIASESWKNNESFYIAWFYKGLENDYLEQVSELAEVLIQTNDYLILRTDENTAIHPPVQGTVVAIQNKKVAKPQQDFLYKKGALTFDPEIEAMMEEVDTVIFIENLQHLQDYGTRNAYSPEAVEAQNWIKAKYESYGYDVELFDFNMPSGPASDNVIATKLGTKYPEEYVVIGGHYDSYSFSGDAPGADDDGTGTCGVMEVARVMADFETDRTVIFCAWSGEEYGLYGSGAWADWAADEGLDILGYFNIDMCGYLEPGDVIHTDMIAPSSAQPLVDFYTDVCALYLPDFVIDAGNLTGGDSDHTSFNNAGYMGIFPFEDSQDYSPYIHTPDDVIGLSVNSAEQAMVFTQAMVANVATMANWLAPPSNLIAIPGDGVIELQWNEVFDIDNYNVYKDNDPTPVVSPTDPFFIDEDVENFTTYTYYVTVVYTETGEESNASNIVTVTPLPAMAFPFEEDFEDGALYWNFESPWGLSSAQSYSPSHSISESPSGDYQNNIEASATLYSFSLENATNAELSFWTKYELETNYDYSYLEISTNGSNWSNLETFNGNQTSWEEKVYPLDDFLGEAFVTIRIRFFSDVWVTEDGMYIDDLKLLVEGGISGISDPVLQSGHISIYPNPADNSCTIEFDSDNSENISIELFNSSGNSVYKETILCKTGTNIFQLKTENFPDGIYQLVINNGREKKSSKLILIH